MKTKCSAIVIASMLALSLAACGSSGSSTSEPVSYTKEASTAATKAATTEAFPEVVTTEPVIELTAVGVQTATSTQIELDQEITSQDGKYSFKLTGVEFTDDVKPSDTSHLYEHYAVKDTDGKTYLVAYVTLYNYSSKDIDADEMISVKAEFVGAFDYTATMVVEERDGDGFDHSDANVNDGEFRKALFMYEIPKQIQEMSLELTISFFGDVYTYVQ